MTTPRARWELYVICAKDGYRIGRAAQVQRLVLILKTRTGGGRYDRT
jgi:hypothetical protein